jgi:hypothetical protein
VSERDSCDIFGEYVATELRKYNERTRSIVQHLIHNILFDADMKKLNDVSALKYVSVTGNANNMNVFAEDKYSPSVPLAIPSNCSTIDNSSHMLPPGVALQAQPITSLETPVHFINASSAYVLQKTASGANNISMLDGSCNVNDVQKSCITTLTTNTPNTQPNCHSPTKKVISPITSESGVTQ